MRITRSVSIVIPMFNEAERLHGTFERLANFTAAHPEVIEVVMVDDGSTDQTSHLLRHVPPGIPSSVISYGQNAGKGYAIRRGILEAAGETVLVSDADLSTPLEELETLYPHLDSYDVVIGSRGLDPSTVRTPQPWYRQAMGKIFNRIMRVITGVPFHDTQCGFKLFKADAARDVFRDAVVDRFAFDVEVLILALHKGYSVAEVPVLWYDVEGSRVSIGRDSARMLSDTIRIRQRLGRPPLTRAAKIRSSSR